MSFIERDFGEFTNLSGRRGFFEEFNGAKLAFTKGAIERYINNADEGDVIRISPGTYTDVGDLVFPSTNVTVIAYGAQIVATEDGISGAPARWPDFNGQDRIRIFGGTWNANPTGGDPPVDGVADYGFANSGGTIEGCRVQDVTATGFASMSIRPRNWTDGVVSDCRAVDTETGFCMVLNTDCTFTGLTAHTFGDTFILADRNDTCVFEGGAAHGDPTGCTHGIDAPSNTDCRFEDFTINMAGDGTDVVNVRDDAGTASTGCVFDVTGYNAVSYGARVQAGAAHEVTIKGEYSGMATGVSVAAGTSVIDAYIHDVSGKGIQSPGGTVIVNGAVVDSPGTQGISVESGEVVSATVRNGAVGSPNYLFVTGTSGQNLGPAYVDRSTTDASGQVVLDWTDTFAFGDKPHLSVQLEAAGEWYVVGWSTDANGRYTGATVQVADSAGAAVASGAVVNTTVDSV